ncbi:hypothetical protein [Telluribacter sp.]|jgi:hypothetical protein|uniref:hypothetical protein n=1 Tax=Telluribacter sp. TaxID=1978767 RepID=UPI002E16246C|nr:hypothetical protein [Telluribacter sp.]
MKGNETDDLFRSNSDYLADQPHRDFNPEAFWQQLQPELPRQTTRKKKGAWWGWTTAATVVLATWLGLSWWMKAGESVGEKTMVEKVIPPADPLRPDLPVPAEEKPENYHPLAKTDLPKRENPKKAPEKEVPEVPAPVLSPAGSVAEQTLAVVSTEEVPIIQNRNADSLQKPTAQPAGPQYRIVHRNDLDRQQETETRARAQVVFRIGLPGSGPASTEIRNPLAISISN